MTRNTPTGTTEISDRKIDKDISAHLHLLRIDAILQGRLKKEDMNMYINSLLSDQKCKSEVTDGYDMVDIEKYTAINEKDKEPRASHRFQKRIINIKDDPDILKKIKNIRKRFLQQKKDNSYKKHPNYINKKEYEDDYKDTVKNFDLRDVALNQIFEFAIRDLLEEISAEYLIGKRGIEDIEVIKTNEYDDVSAKTDFIFKMEYPDESAYKAFDLTLSGNVKNLEKKIYPKMVHCPNYHFNEGLDFTLVRGLLIIDDKEFVFRYLKQYMEQVQKTGNVPSSKEIRDGLGEKAEKIKQDILKQLTEKIFTN